jgi:NADH-quinone oxidoreductase subunit L
MLNALCLTVVLAPLFGAIMAGFFGKKIGQVGASSLTILGVGTAFIASVAVLALYLHGNVAYYDIPLYTWGTSAGIPMVIGFLIDPLTILMMLVVTFVSLMVHVYTIGYMHDDPGYQRFFSYIALFTFSMLMLVMSNNFLQLFFGWEAVGLVSYLLIGFWFKKPSATYANLKAFLVNRVGDLGFLLGIAAVFLVFKRLDYLSVFAAPEMMLDRQLHLFGGVEVSYVTAACILLFIGAMGKSAQVPLHVWLPDSMEGPTPISALIHAATMVTAGIFMVSRLSPLFELSETARTFILVIGATTALFMGFLGIVQNDIKRIIAYSTLSQLGYMVVALGASAYAAGIFHLMTHAFFKALLFLGAGSVIIAMHHEQDIRKMGGLWRVLPITYGCMLIGSLALAGIPPFAGFYSKDVILEAVKLSTIPGSGYAHIALLLGVFVTAMYSFRLLFLVFHTQPRMDKHTQSHLHESPWVVTGPLILLAIPSVIIGALTITPLLFSEPGYFAGSIVASPSNNVLAALAHHFHGVFSFTLHAPLTLPFWLALAGIATAWVCYERLPQIPALLSQRFSALYHLLLAKYGFDRFNAWFFEKGSRVIGQFFWQEGDVKSIDGWMVNGSARCIGRLAQAMRALQSGFLNQYVFVMILGLVGLVSWWFWVLA